MSELEKILKTVTQVLLLAVVLVVPFIKIDILFFPFVSGKVYVFRVLVMLALFFWVWLMLKRKEWRPNVKNILVVSIIAFFFGQVAASFFGVDPVYSLFSSVERADGVVQYGFWVVYFLMLVSVFKEWRDWKIFFIVFAVTAFVLSVYSWWNLETQGQLSGFFGNPAYFAAFLLFAIGFCLVAFERKIFRENFANLAFLALAGFFVITLVFTQVRGVYVGLGGGVLLFCLLAILFLRKENKKLAFACGALLLMGFATLALLFSAKETEFVQSTRMLYRITEVTEIWEKGSTRERLLNWNIALKAFQEKPIFGYGPENYASAANKYYDYRIGIGEPWFDRAHNQPLDTLATGGIIVFSLYLFVLSVAGLLIFKIARKEKILGYLLASLFLAYFLQGLFLFDLLAVYLGLFPLLAFIVFRYNFITGGQGENSQDNQRRKNSVRDVPVDKSLPILGLVGLLSTFVIYTTVVLPYKANAAGIQFYARAESGYFKESRPFAEEAFAIDSPYTTWEIRKRAGWQLMQVLQHQISETTTSENLQEIQNLYSYITPELEKFIKARPYDPQMYFVLARTYRLGSQKLGRQDIEKAKTVLEKAFEYSDLRVEYVNEYAQVLLAEGKVDEAERLVRDYAQKVDIEESSSYTTLGHFYFVTGQYEQALIQYEKAREAGHEFYSTQLDYARYLTAAEKTENYQKVLDMVLAHLERFGPNADTYFNAAVGYLNVGDTKKAKEFYLQAVGLNPEYKQYQENF